MLTAALVVLIAAVTVVEVLPFVKLNPVGAVIAPKFVMALVALFRFKAPAVSVAANVPAVIAADCVTVLPMLKVSVPVPTVDALLKLVPFAELIKALPLPVVVKERLVAEIPTALAIEVLIVPPAFLAKRFKVSAVMTLAAVSV